jgi:hypothetical protein
MQQSAFVMNDVNDDLMLDADPDTMEPSILLFSDLLCATNEDKGKQPRVNHDRMMSSGSNIVESLNDNQQHAYDIVNWHLQETMMRKKPPQLLMILGEGGTGKSKLIQTMTENFNQSDVGE